MIEPVEIENEQEMATLAQLFVDEADSPVDLKPREMLNFLYAHKQHLLLKSVQGGKLAGVIAGLLFDHPFDGVKTAQVVLWYMAPDMRKTPDGIDMFKEFERWAGRHGARRLIVSHNTTIMPQRLQFFYGNRGYRAFEICYVKNV